MLRRELDEDKQRACDIAGAYALHAKPRTYDALKTSKAVLQEDRFFLVLLDLEEGEVVAYANKHNLHLEDRACDYWCDYIRQLVVVFETKDGEPWD